MNTPSSFLQAKQLRHTRQRQQFDEVLALPESEQAQALFARWSEKLPRLVRSEITPSLRTAWRALREEQTETRFQAWMEDHFNAEMKEEVMDHLRQLHGEKAIDLAQVISRIPNLLKITLVFHNQNAVSFDLQGYEDCEDDIINGFCLALNQGAGILIRQELPLKSQVRNAQGELVWVQQNRIYGVYAGHGELVWLSKEQVRKSFMTDAKTGQALPSDGFTNFGDIKDFVRKKT